MRYFTPDERRAIIFVCFVFFLAASVKLARKLFCQIEIVETAYSRLGKLDLNRADKAELKSLPGIGARLAGRICDYRDAHNGFERVEDLLLVKGISRSRFEQLKDFFYIGCRERNGH